VNLIKKAPRLINPLTGKPFNPAEDFKVSLGEPMEWKGLAFHVRKVLKRDIVFRVSDKNIRFNSNETSVY